MTSSFPCSACGMPIKYSASKCPHCGQTVTKEEIAVRSRGSEFDSNALLGCFGFTALMAFAVYVVASTGQSEAERLAADLKFAEEYELKERNARFACFEHGVTSACDKIDEHAELARYYRRRVDEANYGQ